MIQTKKDTEMSCVPGGDADAETQSKNLALDRLLSGFYMLFVLVALSIWFLPIRAPLWLDETSSYWSIAGGFKQIWGRSVVINSFPTYSYILWLTSVVFGSKEIVLRIPSLLAMLAATLILYRSARELFSKDVAAIATVVFILDIRIAFAAIDVRPYAFAILATTAAIFSFLRWSKTQNVRYAALFGVTSAGVFYFHYLFGCCMVAAFALAYFLERWHSPVGGLRQLLVAVGCFVPLIVPVLANILDVNRRRNQFVFTAGPTLKDLLHAVGPGVVPYAVAGVVFVAALTRKLSTPHLRNWRQFMLCAAFAVVPIVSLYGISAMTPLHIFIDRYQAVAVPGIALCWAWIFSQIDSRLQRVLGCALLVTWTAFLYYTWPQARSHGYTWKYALEFADANAIQDGAPLVICSDYPGADFRDMPIESAKDSDLFAPLSYYPVRVPVVPMPRALNGQAKLIGRKFFLQAALAHQRFLVVCFRPSYPTLEWFVNLTSVTHVARVLGSFDGIAVVEFEPKNRLGTP